MYRGTKKVSNETQKKPLARGASQSTMAFSFRLLVTSNMMFNSVQIAIKGKRINN